jgi:hypothetical protein
MRARRPKKTFTKINRDRCLNKYKRTRAHLIEQESRERLKDYAGGDAV